MKKPFIKRIKKSTQDIKKMTEQASMPRYSRDNRHKIAIIQPACWGDNINSTLMLPPLRRKYPEAIIDIHTSETYGSAFDNNGYTNNIFKHKSVGKDGSLHLHITLKGPVIECGYNKIYTPHPMFNPDKWTSIKYPELGDNLICAWIRALEEDNIPYKMPLETILRLQESEIKKVDEFCKPIKNFETRIKNIIEIVGESGQTFWNDSWTNAVVNELCSRGEIVFISHRHAVPTLSEKFPGLCYSANTLSIRECAELFNRCDRFFSVSSALSNAANTNWCKKNIQWIETINSPSVSSAPIRSTGKMFWYNNDLGLFIKMLRSLKE